MKQKGEVVKRIEKQYVGPDCIQYMLQYKDTLTLLNKDGILYHKSPESNLYNINKYLEDERRKQFPYSNIPTHYSRTGINQKMAYTNQLLDFEQPYLRINDGNISELFVVKDNNQALLIDAPMSRNEHTEYMTYNQLESFLCNNSSEGQTYYVYLDGRLPLEPDKLLLTEEEIYCLVQRQLEKNLKDIRKHLQDIKDEYYQYLRKNPWFAAYVEQSIKNLDFSLIDFNLCIGAYSKLIIVRVNNGNISIQGVNIEVVKEDNFRVKIADIPVNKYTLEQLKYVPKIITPKEPKIPLRLNPGVSKQDIEKSREQTKKLLFKNESIDNSNL